MAVSLGNPADLRRQKLCSVRRMPSIRSHKDIIAWQLCEELADLILEITATGPAAKDFELRDQIRRSSGAPGPMMVESTHW